MRLDLEDLTVDGAPVATKIEPVIRDQFEVVLHQPFLDQMRLSQRAPDLFRRIGDLAFDDDGACFGSSSVMAPSFTSLNWPGERRLALRCSAPRRRESAP